MKKILIFMFVFLVSLNFVIGANPSDYNRYNNINILANEDTWNNITVQFPHNVLDYNGIAIFYGETEIDRIVNSTSVEFQLNHTINNGNIDTNYIMRHGNNTAVNILGSANKTREWFDGGESVANNTRLDLASKGWTSIIGSDMYYIDSLPYSGEKSILMCASGTCGNTAFKIDNMLFYEIGKGYLRAKYRDTSTAGGIYGILYGRGNGSEKTALGFDNGVINNKYIYRATGASNTDSGFARSIAWHDFKISYNNTGYIYEIDGIKVGERNDATATDGIGIQAQGTKIYLDNLELVRLSDVEISLSETVVNEISVSLLEPTKNSESNNIIKFNATGFSTDQYNISNLSLVIWNEDSTIKLKDTNYIDNINNNTYWDISNLDVQNYTWNVEICLINQTYSFCNITETNRTLFYGYETNYYDYNTTTTSTSIEGFIINLNYSTSALTDINAILIYNNTQYTTTKSINSNIVTFQNSISIPSIPDPDSKNFLWQIELNNGTHSYYYNTTEYTQYINAVTDMYANITCGEGYDVAMYFNFGKEKNLTLLNFTNVYYNIYYGVGNTTLKNFYGNFSNRKDFSFCINSSVTNYKIGYGEIQYEITDYESRRFYLFEGTRLGNGSINNTLYSLENNEATTFLITAKNTNLQPYENYYISALRWYPELNEYKTIDMGKTDGSGETVIKVKTEDVDYRLGVYSPSGNLIKLFSPIRMICQTTPCTYTLYISSTDADYTSVFDVENTLTFNEDTNIFTFTWNDPSQTTSLMNLTVFQDSLSGTEILCSKSATGFTGILQCDVTGNTGTFYAKAFRSASPARYYNQLTVTLKDTIASIDENFGLFFTMLIITLLSMIGFYINPIMGVVLGVIAFIPAYFIGAVTIGVLTGVILLSFVVIHFMKRLS